MKHAPVDPYTDGQDAVLTDRSAGPGLMLPAGALLAGSHARVS